MRIILSSVLTTIGFLTTGLPAWPAAEPPGPSPLKVVGKHLATPDGKVVRLRGVNIPSLEWCQGEHLFESLAVSIDDWGANIIRLPLSQDRWFGRTKERQDEGAGYRKTVRDFVDKAAARSCYVILDLHWSGAGVPGQHNAQHKMPDDGSIDFWAAVAADYANHPAILFGLYNEPHDVSWDIWRDGGKVSEDFKESKNSPGIKLEYHTPGLQKLLDVCRSKGAKNVVIVGGLDWGYDLTGIAKGYTLADPQGNGIVYDTHLYPWKKDWDRWVTPALDKYPVLVGEFGSDKGDPKAFVAEVVAYTRKHDLDWTAWCMHPAATPNLIKDWKHTPTAFGEAVREALRKDAGR
jgi:endoglucanase